MKRLLWILIAVLAISLSSCKKDDTINCTIYWQLYTQEKHPAPSDIEKAFQQTFFGYYERVNDNTVRANKTTQRDVRSLTVKLSNMADALINDADQTSSQPTEVKVLIDFAGSYIEEVWSKNY